MTSIAKDIYSYQGHQGSTLHDGCEIFAPLGARIDLISEKITS